MLLEKLQKTFAERTRKNPQYSLRSFARSLDIDSSTLSALLRQKRKLTVRTAKHLIEKLGIDDPEEVRNLLLGCFSDASTAQAAPCHELDLAMTEMMSTWEHFAILAVLDLTNFKATSKNISARLNLPFGLVVDCVQRLKILGIVNEDSNGSLVKSEKNLATPSNIPSQKIRQGHRQFIEKSIFALESAPVDCRDISGTTLAINPKNLKEAKQRIQKFRREIAEFLEVGNRESVYRLNIQLFPLDLVESTRSSM